MVLLESAGVAAMLEADAFNTAALPSAYVFNVSAFSQELKKRVPIRRDAKN
jgi:hypothetical protein